ncbi:MAG: NUDIX hydrolase [Haloferacaceae archaeon]
MTADDDAALRWAQLGGEAVFECPGFVVRRDDVRLPEGTEAEYHHLAEPPAVVVLPFTPDGDVVTIAEWRQAVERVNRGLPAGSMEQSEDVETAARRELREETGYEAESVEAVGTVEPANGVSDAVHHHVVARGCTETATQDLDHNESIRVEVRDYADLLAAAVDGGLRDGRAVNALLRHELASR